MHTEEKKGHTIGDEDWKEIINMVSELLVARRKTRAEEKHGGKNDRG
jgi:hypothetical protein